MAARGTEGPAAPLLIRLFGPFEARRDDEPLPPLRTRKGRWLLALLTLRHGRPLEREWLAGTLWPESPDAQALYNLRRCLSDLRRALGTQAHRLQVTAPHSLVLDLTGAEVDVIAFDEALARGDEPALETAVGLYRGPLLEGCDEEWAHQERASRERSYLAALERLAAAATSRSDHASAARFLHRAVAANPFQETAQRALMAALAAAGDTAAAILVYRELRRCLHREMNAEPSPETRALFVRLRSAVQRRALRGGSRLETPQPQVPDDPPPSNREPGTGPRGNLPQPLSAFVGREEEILKVGACLASARLVTLTGTGGIGKTRLAIRVAGECAGEYEDGAWFVDLAALADPALVPQAAARALRVPEAPGRPRTETLQEALGARQLLLVLDNCEHLLDACARLVDALLSACPHLRLLATSRQALGLTGEIAWPVPPLSVPGVRAFGRSGVQAGRVRGESAFDLVDPERPNAPGARPPPLSAAQPRRGSPAPERLMQYEAIRLFVERAAAARPGFVLGERNAGATVQVCRRLDGIPLAIELAAARLGALSLEQIAARLDDRFRLLTGGSRAALPRQQTLRAAMDWSYELLSEPERVVMRRLSVFAGGWTLEAAEAVISGQWALVRKVEGTGARVLDSVGLPTDHCPLTTDLLDLLASLVAKSLVLYEEREAGARYRLLETVRQYFSERLLEAGEAEATRGRHLEYFLALAEAAEPQLTGARQGEWLERLEAEHDNLRAALVFARRTVGVQAVVSGQSPVVSEVKDSGPELTTNHQPLTTAAEMGQRLAGALWRFWNIRGYLTEGREQLAQALASAPERTVGRAKALETAGSLAYGQADYRSARSLQEESLAIRRELGDHSGIAASLRNLGLVAYQEGDYGIARSFHEQSLAINREVGNRWGIAASLHDLGLVAYQQGDLGAARSLQEESLAIRRELGDHLSIATSLYGLGLVASQQGNHGAARSYYEESLAIRRELGHHWGIASSLCILGLVYFQEGDYGAARSLSEESLAIRRELNDRRGIARSLYDLGRVASQQGEYGAARSLYEESLAIFRELGIQRWIAASLYNLGLVAYQQGEYEAARSLYEESVASFRELGEHPGIADSLHNLGLVAYQEGDYRAARSLYEEGLVIRREVGDRGGIAGSLEALAALAGEGEGQPGAGAASGAGARSQPVEAIDLARAAARLFGAAAALREATGAPVPPGEPEMYRGRVRRAREMLGEAAFAAAWEAGRALPLDEAIRIALQESEIPSSGLIRHRARRSPHRRPPPR